MKKHKDDEITDREAATVGALTLALPQGKDMEHNAACLAERMAVKVNGLASKFDEIWPLANAEFKATNRSSVEDIARHFFLLGCATTNAAHELEADAPQEINVTKRAKRLK